MFVKKESWLNIKEYILEKGRFPVIIVKKYILSQFSNVGSIKKGNYITFDSILFLCVGWVEKEKNAIECDIIVLF